MINKLFSIFALFIPSWNFFGGSEATPYLLVSVGEEYHPVCPPKKVNLLNLIYNPNGNLYLLHHSHMQALLNEIFNQQDNPHFDLENSPFFKLARNWAEFYLFQNKIESKMYQLKFAYVKRTLDNIEIVEEIFQSPSYELLTTH